MINLFPNDSYDTPSDQRDIFSKCLFNTRFYFFFRTYYNFYKISKCAARGEFNQANQSYYSGLNFRILENCGARIHLRGLNHLDSEKGPFVIIGNHMSSVETAILNAIISPRLNFTFVIKNSLFSVPFLGTAMRAIDAIGVDRENPRDDFKIIMEEGRKRLEKGISVLIFPESTRQDAFLPERFNSVGIKLAKLAGVKIIPFALKTDFLVPGKLIPEFGPVDLRKEIFFEFGPSVEISGNGKKEHRDIVDFITERTSVWKQEKEKDFPAVLSPLSV